MALILTNGLKNHFYSINRINLPLKTAKRLEALGMTEGVGIAILNKKKSAMIISIRGTRVALGSAIAQNIEIELGRKQNDDRIHRKSEQRQNYSF
jgi:Fe2+ transport system protein FeoA